MSGPALEDLAVRDHVDVNIGKGRIEAVGIRGEVIAILRGPDGQIKQIEVGSNLVTDNGDEELATRIFDDTEDIVTGMRLGND